MLLHMVTSIEDVVLVEDASDEDEIISDAQVTVEDAIFLITNEDEPSHSMFEVKANELQLIVDSMTPAA